MFRRKEDGTEELIDEADNDNIEESDVTEVTDVTESVSFPTAGSAAAPAANAASASAPAAASNFRPAAPQAAMAARPAAANQSAPASSASSSASSASAAPAASSTATPSAIQPTKRVLTVGPDIQMKGEITTCDRVVIEGVVDATMKDVHTVELAQSGSLKGTAEVEDAEISGIFEGDLVVHGRLIVYSTGVIRGNVTYGEIEIERGGQISGNVQNVAAEDSKGKSQRKAA